MPREKFKESYADIIAMQNDTDLALENYFTALQAEDEAIKVVLPAKGMKID